MLKLKEKSGFTLLEIIIVVIIIGVLASLALPRFFKTVEYSRTTEALSHLSSIRQAMSRCYLQRNSYSNCASFATLDVEDPGTLANAHFTFTQPFIVGPVTFTVTAQRNTFERPTPWPGGTITINETGTKLGTGYYAFVQ